MRLFIAIDLPEEWRELLAKPQQSIGWLGHGVKWVDPKSTHLTLKFLGETAPNLVDEIMARATASAARFPIFTIRMRGTGVFPDPKKPRVYWAGVEAPQTLLDLQADLEREMEELGFERELRAFSPHLTIARIKDPMGKQRMTEALLNYKIDSGPERVTQVVLIRSHLSEGGAHYESLAHFPLKEI
jgi:2'-5' RNA ligase